MKAKEYLLQYKRMKMKLASLEADIEATREEREQINADLNGLPRGSAISDRTGNLATALADMEMELVNTREETLAICRDVINTINQIEDQTLARLLHLRYIELKTWNQIADEMYFSSRWVYGALHSAALKEVEQILVQKNY